jgi:hypothetical protein
MCSCGTFFFFKRRSLIGSKLFKDRVNTLPDLLIQKKARIIRDLSQTLLGSPCNTSRHSTSSMHTNHEWGSQYLHSARQPHEWYDVFPTGIFHSAKSSGLLSHNLLHTHTSNLQQFEIYQDAIEQSNVQIKPLTHAKQTSLLLQAPKPRPKCHIWKNRMSEPTSIRIVPFCLPYVT